MEPDFERLARMPCPTAALASSSTRPFSSALAFSRWRKASRVRRNGAGQSFVRLLAQPSIVRPFASSASSRVTRRDVG